MANNLKTTATPVPYIETILPGRNKIKGWVGTIVNNKVVPEPNAYIYIYINGFLINPPEVLPDGGYKNTKTSVVSLADGKWETSTFFFDVLPAFEYGAVITFKAKAPLKGISESSVPYAIGATPTPIELGVYDSFGIRRDPYEGETSVMGRMSYWFRQEPDINGRTGYPQFNCDNQVYVYIDGVHQGSSLNGGIGEIYKNEIRGTSATFPIFDNIRNQVLPIKVGANQVNVPFIELNPSDQPDVTGIQDGSNTKFIFTLEESNVGFRIFKNGQRLTEGQDYTYDVLQDTSASKSIVEITFGIAPVPVDRISIVVQYNITAVILHEYPKGAKDGVNTIFTLYQVPYAGSLELFKNGLKLSPVFPDPDYVLQGNIITLTFPLNSDDRFIADYQPILPNSTQAIYSSEIYGIISEPTDPSRNVNFLVNFPDAPGNLHIFKNGLKLKKGTKPDEEGNAEVYGDYYTDEVGNVITFTGLGIPVPGDVLNASFYTAPVTLQQLIKYLNNTIEFSENCLVADILNVQTIKNYFIPEQIKNGVNRNFTIPFIDVPVDVRMYKNGRRLTKSSQEFPNGEYTIDYTSGEVVFFTPPVSSDKLIGLFTYKLSDFITEKKPKPTADPNKFALDFVPKADSVSLYINGVRINPLANPPIYTIENNLIVFTFAPPPEGAVMVVDYEVSYGLNNLIENVLPSGNIDGANSTFSYPTQRTGTAINVFKNGLLQVPQIDFNFTSSALTFNQESIPQVGDTLVLEMNLGNLFTDNPKDQLRIISPYAIELVEYAETSFIQNLLFGNSVVLWPGKGEDDQFMFWFDRTTGYWKWTSYNPYTGETKPFVTGQHISARAWNKGSIKYN